MGYIKIIGLVAVVGLLGGSYLYVSSLQNKNARLHEEVAILKGNIEQLNTTMQVMKKEQERLNQLNRDVRDEVIKLRTIDEQSQKKVHELSQELASREHREQLDRVSASRGASLHLRLVNKGAKCQWDHFADFSGRCVGGKWEEYEKTTKEPATSEQN